MKKTEKMEAESSAETKQIMGHMPHWIIRCGITLMFLIIALLIGFSCFFSYPDMIAAKIELVSDYPTVALTADKSGKIAGFLVADKQKVLQDTPLLILASQANPEHIQDLKLAIANIQNNLNQNQPFALDLNCNRQLGDIDDAYADYLKAYQSYQLFGNLKYHQTKMISLQEQIKQHELLCEQYREQNEFRIAELQIAILRLNEAILEIKLHQAQQQDELQNATRKLSNKIKRWEDDYLLRAPIAGTVSFAKFKHVNQDVKTGDILATITPETNAKISGQIELPLTKTGKVKTQQTVNIKLERYPYMEYGVVKGIIGSITLMPSAEKTYIAEVELPNGLNTSYKRTLEYTPGMEGIAEIITDNQTVAIRFIQPAKSIFKRIFPSNKSEVRDSNP